MGELNKYLFMGRLTADPEIRHTGNGNAVSDLRLVTNNRYTTSSGEQREDTLFIDCTVWGRTAENCCNYLRKGSKVFIEGRLKLETWEDKKTGEKRSKIKLEADRVQFLDSKRSDETEEAPEPAPAPARQAAPAPARTARPAAGRRQAVPAADEMDDTIPF
jgi:single-strand DNA-binding protein